MLRRQEEPNLPNLHANRVLGTFAALAGLTVVLGGCPEKIGGASAAGATPSQALTKVLASAKSGDEAGFKNGLTKNFVLTVERYQELSTEREELKGAFEWRVFMKAMSLQEPQPKEELIKGNKATVRAIDKHGKRVTTRMLLEDGVWKMEVPPELVTQLDHFDDIAKLAEGKPVAEKPGIPTGGGGKADRVKNLPKDASPKDRQKAGALDAFDLGDLAGAAKKLEEARTVLPDDEELVVALGRAYVQTQKVPEAIGLFEQHLKKDDKAVVVRHYLGMAYMFDRRHQDAANEWKKVGEIDAAYSAKFKLDNRAQIAEGLAKGNAPQIPDGPHGESPPPVDQPGAAPGPASQPGH